MEISARMSVKVSIIIPTYNRGDLLSTAVNSVLCQTFTDFELIIVDDCSTDNTQETIADFEDSRISTYRHIRNKGPATSRNTGIVNARGEFIAFLDDDDEWLPRMLELLVPLLEESIPQVALIYGWSDKIDDSSGRLMPSYRSTLAGNVFENELKMEGLTALSSALVRASAIREVGGFDERYSYYGEDSNFLCRIFRRYHVACCPVVVTITHVKHRYSRLTDPGYEVWRRSSATRRMFLEDFEYELRDIPKARSALLRQLAHSELLCAERRSALTALMAAVKLDPVSTLARYIWRLLWTFIWYATPLSRFREQVKTAKRIMFS